MNAPFEWASLFTAEKFSERPGLNEPRLCFYDNEIYKQIL